MTTPQPIGAMSSNRVILGELLSSRARLRFPANLMLQPTTPVRRDILSERHTGTSQTVSLQGVTPKGCQDFTLCRRSRPVAEHFNRGDDLYKSRLEGANRFLGK